MVNAVSAAVFAAVAFNAATTLALPSNAKTAVLMERDYENFDIDARELYDFDERDFYDIDEYEARELLEHLDARDFEDEGMDAREVEEVFQYLRAVTATTTHPHHATKTVTHTHTHTPHPTACTKKELKQHEREAKKAKAAAKKAKAIADKKKKIDKKTAKKAKKEAAKKAKIAKEHGLVAPTTTTSHSASATTHATSTTAAASRITPAPVLKAIPGKISLHTVTHFGTVTVKVTTTAARPQCTKGHHRGLFSKLVRHKQRSVDGEDIEEMMSRELDVDQLD